MEAEFYFIINGFVAIIRAISALALFTPTLHLQIITNAKFLAIYLDELIWSRLLWQVFPRAVCYHTTLANTGCKCFDSETNDANNEEHISNN